MKLGAQMYTVHDFTKTLEGLDESLKKIADIGYKYVQVSGTCPYDATWLKEKLDLYGLSCVITHCSKEQFLDTEKLIANHNILNCNYIGIGGMPDLWKLNPDNDIYSSFLEEFKPIFRTLKENGKYFMYHNHDIEFIKMPSGLNMIEQLSKDVAADELGFTLDTYWIQAGGGDPAKYIRDLKGRVPCVHLKDMILVRGKETLKELRMAPVYEGSMNFDAILDACEYAGTEYLLVEQDNCYESDPFECLKISYNNLKAKGLE